MFAETPFRRHAMSVALAAACAVTLAGCDHSPDSPSSKPAEPTGLGAELSVPLPSVSYPLPVSDNGENNADSTYRWSVDTNPMAYLLLGMNKVWKLNLDGWQENANGNGPDTSFVDNQTIVNATIWQQNIQYVMDVTADRTDAQAIQAFLDDQRSKNYSVIDGYGPLTEAYVAASGAYTDINVPTTSDVLSNSHYVADNNDGIAYAGDASSDLGAVYQLVYDFRQASPASTNASKYIYSTPRPWRMDDSGTIDYQGTTSYVCTDPDGTSTTETYDVYTSSVVVVPGLMCARRANSEDSYLDQDGSNQRKDGAYPSGHTNAGYLAAMAYAYALPQRFSEMLTRGSQLGEDRILAGMHSPVDVIGGRIHAMAVAAYALGQSSILADAQSAYSTAQSYFGELADQAGESLYDYAHATVVSPGSLTDGDNVNTEVFNNNDYSDHAAMKALYRQRLTYGFTQTGSAGEDPVVPEGAERLLASRQPYLTAAQRRAVIYTTEIDSGYPIIDDSNGWGRIDLVTAADGYGAFVGDVTVNMDASDGGFSSHDWWRNDISGEGLLTKEGTGTLTLTGDNSYSGGTLVKAGTLEAASSSAFGSGDLYMTGGEVEVNADGALNLANYTQDDGSLVLEMDNDDTQVSAADIVYLSGGNLVLDFGDTTPTSGSQYTLLTGSKVYGKFASVSTDADVSISLKYTGTAVIATIK
ncbi:autotransporter-associated beta strand repeat-containing protein [Gallaecimonas mangrovi]|uniref:autotransporter-associated beta strand repeat-containing protein n=1 Tax=Gallaecimonas mangrovi TaxID=2291597 RepID=UPI00299F7F54|nr:autotransporter-associated beta strand repeat-containing protein [Gallaecimonas mangrovi]